MRVRVTECDVLPLVPVTVMVDVEPGGAKPVPEPQPVSDVPTTPSPKTTSISRRNDRRRRLPVMPKQNRNEATETPASITLS